MGLKEVLRASCEREEGKYIKFWRDTKAPEYRKLLREVVRRVHSVI